MIAVVSLNACVDKTFYVPSLADGVVRPEKTFVQAGGKGINAARVLRNLGDAVSVFTMLAGHQGDYIEALLRRDGFSYDAIRVQGESRMYLTVFARDCRQMALKENGPQLSSREAEAVRAAFLAFLQEKQPEFLCVCDSIACPGLTDFYPFAVREAKRRGIPVLLDADLAALELGLREKPDYIKPNLEEYAAVTGRKPETVTLSHALSRLEALGIAHPLISLGAGGCAFLYRKTLFRAVSRDTACTSPVGCGDSFIAGLVHGLVGGKSFADAVCLGTAAGSANAKRSDAANVTSEEVAGELGNVVLEKL